ncbi:MAG: hypothetical protein R6V55_12760 [Desulfovermiculus sp.]
MDKINTSGQKKCNEGNDRDKELEFQKELALEYFHLLHEAEKKQDELHDQLRAQKDLTLQYHQALSMADTENIDLKSRIPELRKHFYSLLSSRRWKMGNALGKIAGLGLMRVSRPGAVDRMQYIFTELGNISLAKSTSGSQTPGKVKQLVIWMQQLDKEFQALLSSRSWKIGNALGLMAKIIPGRRGKRVAVHRMQQIFFEFENWKLTVNTPSLSQKDIAKLHSWLTRLEKELNSFLRSKRWRIGNPLGNATGRLRGRSGKHKDVDRMQSIFDQYKDTYCR